MKNKKGTSNTAKTKSLVAIAKKRTKLARTTFSLSNESLNHLTELAKYNKITDVFRAIHEFWIKDHFSHLWEESIAVALSDEENLLIKSEPLTTKSFAIDAHINKFLSEKANELEVSRNILLAGSLYQIHLIQSSQIESANTETKKGLKILKTILEQIEKSEYDLGKKLGDDSEIVKAFGVVPITLNNLISVVETCIQNNEAFDAYMI
jgi:hypothetical protein